jgi:hypothetical protein
VIVATVIAVPRLWPGHAATGTSLALAQGPAFAGGRVPGGPPPRYVAEVVDEAGTGLPGTTALKIVDAATGAVTGQLSPPRAGLRFQAVAALGSDRQFVAAATAGMQARHAATCTTWLYQFGLTADGQPADLRPLSVPKVAGFAQNSPLTASADGQIIAYDTHRCGNRMYNLVQGQIGTINLRTGSTRTWTYRWPAEPGTLSLSADGSLLAMVSNPSTGTHMQEANHNSAWLLPASSPSGPVNRYYRPVVRTTTAMTPLAAALSPTGAVTFVIGPTGPNGGWQREELPAYRTATGQRIAVVHRFPATGMITENPLLAASSSGRYLLLAGWNDHLQRIDVATGHVTQRPGRSARSAASVAW